MEYSKVYSSSPTDGDGKNYLLFERWYLVSEKRVFKRDSIDSTIVISKSYDSIRNLLYLISIGYPIRRGVDAPLPNKEFFIRALSRANNGAQSRTYLFALGCKFANNRPPSISAQSDTIEGYVHAVHVTPFHSILI